MLAKSPFCFIKQTTGVFHNFMILKCDFKKSAFFPPFSLYSYLLPHKHIYRNTVAGLLSIPIKAGLRGERGFVCERGGLAMSLSFPVREITPRQSRPHLCRGMQDTLSPEPGRGDSQHAQDAWAFKDT